MNQQFAQRVGRTSCHFPSANEPVQGIVQQVDTVSRELTVRLPTGLKIFDVALNCSIFLRGERIKLRLVQPGDLVQIFFKPSEGLLLAHRLNVQPHAALAVDRVAR